MFSKAILTAGVFGLAALSTVKAAPTTNDEAQALDVINHSRYALGQPALVWDVNLQDDAYAWSAKMAASGEFDHAPAADRKDAVELISMFRSEDRNDKQISHPIFESVHLWLDAVPEERVAAGFQELGLAAQLLSSNATHIGCANSGTSVLDVDDNEEWFQYTVCRVIAEIKSTEDDNTITRRQDLSEGPFTGDITFFNPALGACGNTDNDTSIIVALSQIKMGTQSNNNPLCGRTVVIEAEGKSVNATVSDKCMGCAVNDIDVTPAVFTQLLGDLGRGRVSGVTWHLAPL